ncbi:MAG: hypothetical protein N2572_04455 [Syntrophales bacterium]|nr:hypothetical protein [Syntrophales bacterium]
MRYEINGKIYVQEKLSVGQASEILSLIRNSLIFCECTTRNVIIAIAENLPRIVAVILREEEVPLEKKNVDKLEREFSMHMDMDTAIKVMADFFECNNVKDILKGFMTVLDKFHAQLEEDKK